MSLVKSKKEHKIILDFSAKKVSKNLIKKSLKDAQVQRFVRKDECNTIYMVDNIIKIGMYFIKLNLVATDDTLKTKIKHYGNFNVNIYDVNKINLLKDRRFKSQYWVSINKNNGIKVKSLIDIIMYVKKLNNLKVFL